MNEEETRCKVCKEEIIKGAKKCTHCDSFQNWIRRVFGLSNTRLAFVLAIISYLTGLLPKTHKGNSNAANMSEEKVRCKVCKEEIIKGAKKCTHCDSFQNWIRRVFGLSNTVLVLLLAILSVLTVLLPKIHEFFPRSNIQIAFQGSSKEHIIISAYNEGNLLGRIDEPQLTFSPMEKKNGDCKTIDTVPGPLQLKILDKEEGENIIPPDRKIRIIKMTYEGTIPIKTYDSGEHGACQEEMEVTLKVNKYQMKKYPFRKVQTTCEPITFNKKGKDFSKFITEKTKIN